MDVRIDSIKELESGQVNFGAEMSNLCDKVDERPRVFLCEVLEVRGKSLNECEMWSVLCQAVEVIQDLFLRVPVEPRLPKLLITPSNLAFTCTGKVQFANLKCEDEDLGLFTPPEFDSGGDFDEDWLEKICIYSLGQTLKYAAIYPNKLTNSSIDSINLSLLLKSTLNSMCQPDAVLRNDVLGVLEVISHNIHRFTQNKPFTCFIGRLYREVLGFSICDDSAKDYNLFSNQRVKRSESTSTARSENDKYGRRMGFCPRNVRRSESQRSDVEDAKESSERRVSEDLTVCHDRKRLMEILQLDVTVPDVGAANDTERFRSKSLADVNCEANDVSKVRSTNSIHNIPFRLQSQCDTKHKSKMILSRPTFRSIVYDPDNYPKLMQRRKSSITKTPKNIIGPEFVVMSSKPSLPLTLNIKNKEISGNSHHIKHLKQVIIVLLNGRRLETNCDLTVTKVHHLWESIVNHEKFNRKFLYGLAYIKDGEFIFLDPELKLQKIVSPGWTEWRGNNQMDVTSFTVYVRVKFYINHNLMRDRMTRHLQYLQLRRDILEERIRCDPQKSLFLASLALQAEFGDFDENVFGKDYFFNDHYLSPSTIKYLGQVNAKRQLISLHGSRKGVTEELAENEFIEMIEELTEYGFHFHTVQEGKKMKNSKTVCLGISLKGIGLFDTTEKRLNEKFFEWRTIERITYDEKHLHLTIMNEKLSHKKEKLKFRTDKAKNRYLFHIATAHHRLHLILDCNIHIPDLTFQDAFENNENVVGFDNEISYELNRSHDETYKSAFEFEQIEENEKSAFVLGTSFGPPKNLSEMCNEAINDTLASRFDKLGNTSVNERRLVATTLHRSPTLGFGLSVAMGDDQGIYIQSILSQSPAELSRVLQQGDRIFSINQILVDCMEYEQVLDLIRECRDKIDIVVSQQIPIHELSTINEEFDLTPTKTSDFDTENNVKTTENSILSQIPKQIASCHETSCNDVSCFDTVRCNGNCEIIKYQKFVEQLQNKDVNSICSESSKNESDTAISQDESVEKMRCVPVEEDVEREFNEDGECDQIKAGDIFHIVLEKSEGSFGINIKVTSRLLKEKFA